MKMLKAINRISKTFDAELEMIMDRDANEDILKYHKNATKLKPVWDLHPRHSAAIVAILSYNLYAVIRIVIMVCTEIKVRSIPETLVGIFIAETLLLIVLWYCYYLAYTSFKYNIILGRNGPDPAYNQTISCRIKVLPYFAAVLFFLLIFSAALPFHLLKFLSQYADK